MRCCRAQLLTSVWGDDFVGDDHVVDTTVSYPPASHQSIALVSMFVGLTTAFVAVQLAAVVTVIVGVYRFSLLWVSREAAGWAALLAVVSSSIAEVVHTFGQLPTMFALGFLLNAQPSIRRWVHDGVRTDLIVAIALLAATTAGHHVTTLFGSVFFTGPVAVRAVLDRWGTPLANEAAGHTVSVRPSLLVPQIACDLLLGDSGHRSPCRAGRRSRPHIGHRGAAVLAVVEFGFDHPEGLDRAQPVPLRRCRRPRPGSFRAVLAPLRGCSPPKAVAAGVAVGSIDRAAVLARQQAGTTPIPRMPPGGAFDILTLDRFTIWTTVAILPFAGSAIVSLRTWRAPFIGVAQLGSIRRGRGDRCAGDSDRRGHLCRHVDHPSALPATRDRPCADQLVHEQGPARPLALSHARVRRSDGVGRGEHDGVDRRRQLSLGPPAARVDESLGGTTRRRQVPRRPGHRFTPAVPDQPVAVSPQVRVPTIICFYDPLLWSAGWQRIGVLDNDVEVWERADVPPLPNVLPEREIPDWQRTMWGILPMASVASGILRCSGSASGAPSCARLRALGRARPGRAVSCVASTDGWNARPIGSSVNPAWVILISNPGCRSTDGSSGCPLPPAARSPRAQWLATARPGADRTAPSRGQRRVADSGPSATIEAFYDALDFQRFEDADDLLKPGESPTSRPTCCR